MMDSGIEPIMIRKQLAKDLNLIVIDLEPYSFTIVTSIGGTEHAIIYTKQPL